jgi:hypothetical protein
MYISPCGFAHTCVLVKQSMEPISCDLRGRRRPFLLTYGTNLPNSLTRANSYTLVYSTYLPVAVSGTVTYMSHIEGFPARGSTRIDKHLSEYLYIATRVHLRRSKEMKIRIYQDSLPYYLNADLSTL